jgi:hypothetical protein
MLPTVGEFEDARVRAVAYRGHDDIDPVASETDLVALRSFVTRLLGAVAEDCIERGNFGLRGDGKPRSRWALRILHEEPSLWHVPLLESLDSMLKRRRCAMPRLLAALEAPDGFRTRLLREARHACLQEMDSCIRKEIRRRQDRSGRPDRMTMEEEWTRQGDFDRLATDRRDRRRRGSATTASESAADLILQILRDSRRVGDSADARVVATFGRKVPGRLQLPALVAGSYLGGGFSRPDLERLEGLELWDGGIPLRIILDRIDALIGAAAGLPRTDLRRIAALEGIRQTVLFSLLRELGAPLPESDVSARKAWSRLHESFERLLRVSPEDLPVWVEQDLGGPG